MNPRLLAPVAGACAVLTIVYWSDVKILSSDPEVNAKTEGIGIQGSVDATPLEPASSLVAIGTSIAGQRIERESGGIPAAKVDSPDEVDSSDEGQAEIHIGPYIDPHDPSTWPETEREPIHLGEYINPNDPSTWPEPDAAEIHVGEYVDPMDLSTQPNDEASQPLHIGEHLDPLKPETWPSTGEEQVIRIGEYIDARDYLDRR